MSARSLEGKKFFTTQNNGVIALVSEDVYAGLAHRAEIQEALMSRNDSRATLAMTEGLAHMGTPTFTFARRERFVESPWFTGDCDWGNGLFETLCSYIQAEGGRVVKGGFYVPFSNGCETGLHGPTSMADELRHVTTEVQFRATFGLNTNELAEWGQAGK